MAEENQNRAFQERVLRYQEKNISPEELRTLNEDLRDSPECRAEFARMCVTTKLIQEAFRTRLHGKKKVISGLRWATARRGWMQYAGMAAIVMLCLALAGLLWIKRDSDWGDAVAKVEMVSSNAVIAGVEGVDFKEGALLGKGWVQINKGKLRLQFRSGAIMTLEAPASIGIDSAMRSYLEFGKVNVYAPESARNFVVSTTAMEVVDLGTRFEMNVDPGSGNSEVKVTEGLVDLHLGSRGTQRQIQPLQAGWEAEVDGGGNIVNMEAEPEKGMRADAALLAHWKLDGLSGDGQVPDSGPSGISGLFRGESLANVLSGKAGGALDLGSRGYLDLSPHTGAVAGLDSFTFTAWVRDPTEPVGILFSISDGTARNRIQLNLNRKNLVYLWQNGSSYWDSIAGHVDGWTPGQWYHVAVSVSPAGVRLYRNGELLASGSTGVQIGTPVLTPRDVQNPKEVFLGHVSQGTAQTALIPQWFGGVMDDVQLYANLLDHSAIRHLYENPGATLPGSTGKH